MISIIVQFFKLLRHVLPFLNEVTNPADAKDEKDRMVIEHLRSLIRTVLWRIVFFAIFLVSLFYFVIPLYTENAVLRNENEEQEKRIDYLEDRLESAQKARDENNSRLNQCEVKLVNQEGVITALRHDLDERYPRQMAVVLPPPPKKEEQRQVKEDKVKPSVFKPKFIDPKDKPVTPPKTNQRISPSVEQRLNTIE